MKTILPQSTISYNSEEFLRETLNRLVKNGILGFWCFIKHNPEDDEKKAHIHLYMEPVNKVDTAECPKLFWEPDRYGQILKTMTWRTTKSWPDWLWYSIHDKSYLAMKGENRKYHYSVEDIIASDYDELLYRINEAPRPQSKFDLILEMSARGYSALSIARALNTDIRFLSNTLKGIQAIQTMTFRGGRDNHEEEEPSGDNNDILPF